ncbi:N-terminal cleavage protein [Opitutaceae bacterium TAV5]|nr:N-terminal cleavage protein [Opitutaceae bacterium TAV5]
MKTNCRAAFTLIELLTVIAIIGILAAILIPTVGAVRAKADASVCLGRMRQIGTAIAAYMVDNRDTLIGPHPDQRVIPWFNPGGSDEEKNKIMAARLKPYIGIPLGTANGRVYPEVFQCPSTYKRPSQSKTGRKEEIISRLLNTRVHLDGDSNPTTNPWGNYNSPSNPITYSRLGASVSLSRTWAIRECALGYADRNPGTAAGWILNKDIPHGNDFNILYFDWHVGKLAAEQFKD